MVGQVAGVPHLKVHRVILHSSVSQGFENTHFYILIEHMIPQFVVLRK